MRFIPTIAHGLADYLVGLIHLLLDALFGIAMLAAPTLLNLSIDSRVIVYVIGALSILLSFTTKIRAHGTGSQAAV